MTPFETFTALFQVILIMFAYSVLLWKESHMFRFAQYSLAAVALANAAVYTVLTVIQTGITPMLGGSIQYIIPIILGALLYTRLVEQYAWMSRWGMAALVGTGLGLALRGMVESQIVNQIQANFLPLIGGNITPFDNIVMILTTILVMLYFFFTIRPKEGAVASGLDMAGRIGRMLMMLAFGSMFGNIVMTRMSWLGSRIGFVVDTLMQVLGLR
jgi:hypothetical protein